MWPAERAELRALVVYTRRRVQQRGVGKGLAIPLDTVTGQAIGQGSRAANWAKCMFCALFVGV